jgi:hypothetical protein
MPLGHQVGDRQHRKDDAKAGAVSEFGLKSVETSNLIEYCSTQQDQFKSQLKRGGQ